MLRNGAIPTPPAIMCMVSCVSVGTYDEPYGPAKITWLPCGSEISDFLYPESDNLVMIEKEPVSYAVEVIEKARRSPLGSGTVNCGSINQIYWPGKNFRS